MKGVATLVAVAAILAAYAMFRLGLAGMVNLMVPAWTYHRVADLAYGDGPRQVLDVYIPSRQRPGGQAAPVVVFFYGGSWQSGDRADYRFVGEALASRGFLVLIPDYRTYPETIFPGFVVDAAHAVRWARDHAADYGGDSKKLFIMGHSAGAHIAALLATDAHYLAGVGLAKCDISGVIGLAGPYDFLPLTSETLIRIFPPAEQAASQPIGLITGDEPPMLLAAGDRDTTVDPGNTTRFAQALRRAHDEVEVKRYPHIGHLLIIGAFSPLVRPFIPVLDDVTEFIKKHSQASHPILPLNPVNASPESNIFNEEAAKETSGCARVLGQ